MYRRILLFAISISLSLGDHARHNSDSSTSLASLYVGDVNDCAPTTAIANEQSSIDNRKKLNIELQIPVSVQRSSNRLLAKAACIDDGVDTSDTTRIKLHLVPARDENAGGDDCHDKKGGDRSALKIISRKEWNASVLTSKLEPRSKPADCVILDAAVYEKDAEQDYPSRLQEIELFEKETYGFPLRDFIVGEDGEVYESLGFDWFTSSTNGGLGKWSLTVAFIKESGNDTPSQPAIEGFNSFVREAVCSGKLSRDYKVIPYHLVNEYTPLSEDHFERKELREWERFEGVIDVAVSIEQFPVVFREEWGWRMPTEGVEELQLPIEYVVVRDYDNLCFTPEACMLMMQWDQDYGEKNNESYSFNFLIGDDGRAYEVHGWDYSIADEGANKSAIVVAFFGRYHSYPPSARAMKAFNTLLRLSVLWGKISTDYKILSFRTFEKDVIYMGDRLDEEVRKMERFTEEL